MIGKLLRDLGWLAPGPFWTRPRKRIARRTLFVAFAVWLYAVWGDDLPPKEEALRRGDELVGKNQPLQAAAAYRMAVERDPEDGRARFKLAKAYADASRWREATTEAVRAADLLPGDLDAQKLAITRLLGVDRFYDGRTRATALLNSHPEDPELLVLWANATARIPDSSWALYTFPNVAPPITSMIAFNPARRELRKGIPEADDAEAGAAIRKARRAAPDSWDVKLAMVNFLWATGRPDEAEATLKELADEKPGHAVVNYALAAFYRWNGRLGDAEVYLKNAAAAGPFGRQARSALVDVYLTTRRPDEALTLLTSMLATDNESGGVSLQAANVAWAMNRRQVALEHVNAFLELHPHHAEATLLKSRVLFALGRVDEALAFAREAVEASPRSGEAHEAVGQALFAKGDVTGALSEYTQATQLSPGAAQPQLRLARMALDLGRNKMAIEYAKEAVRRFPGDREAGVMMADAQIRNRDLSGADFTLRPLVSNFPDAPDVLVQVGALHAARGDARAARTSYARALQKEPANYAALAGLVGLDLQERAMASARQRVETAVAAHENDARYLMLAARTYLADNDAARAETVLRHAVAIDPSNVDAARTLADSLAGRRQEAEARQILEQLVERMPASTAAQTSLAMLQERMGDAAGARTRYERIVVADPRAAVASQRLGALYLRLNENLDVALNLAIVAVQEMPDDPASNDLLGWIYTQKGLSLNALPHLEGAVRTVPGNAVYRYHLGTAYMRTGNEAKARTELARALEIDPAFEEARAAIARLRP